LADQQILAVVQPRDRFFHTLTLAISSPFRLLRFAALRKSYSNDNEWLVGRQ